MIYRETGTRLEGSVIPELIHEDEEDMVEDAKYVLKQGNEVKYSPTEKMLFSFLPQDGTKITTDDLVKKRKRRSPKSKPWDIENPRNAICTTMHYGLIRKIIENNENFRVIKSDKLGPYPTEYWIVSRGRAPPDAEIFEDVRSRTRKRRNVNGRKRRAVAPAVEAVPAAA
jgi:hypothetical protein